LNFFKHLLTEMILLYFVFGFFKSICLQCDMALCNIIYIYIHEKIKITVHLRISFSDLGW